MNLDMKLEQSSIQLAQTLWGRLSATQKADYMVLVYRILLNRHPEYKDVFPHELESVRDNMTDTINYLIQHLDQPEKCRVVFECLGAKHKKLNITPNMFSDMVRCKVEALDEFFGGTLSLVDKTEWGRVMSYFAVGIIRAYPE